MSKDLKSCFGRPPSACFPSFSQFRGDCRYPSRLYAIVGLMYVAVALSTMVQPGFAVLSGPAFLFYAGVALSFSLAWLVGKPAEGPAPRGLLLYFPTQWMIFMLLNRLPIPHDQLWLLVMPVISHATFFLQIPALLLVCTAFMGAIIWTHPGVPLSPAAVVQVVVGFGTAFLFTIVYTLITRNAIASHTEARRLADELEEANLRLRENADRTAALAAMSERNRIARDIHDGLGHYLTIVAVQLEGARKLLAQDPGRASAALEKAEELSRSALDEIRRSVATLRCNAPGPALHEALAGLVTESGLPASFSVAGDSRPLSDGATQALFRVAQEGLTNVRKHALAQKVEVRLEFTPQRVAVHIADNGRGSPAGPSTGFGLSGLRERLEQLGGHLHTANRSEGGFLLRAELPA